jgi:hypothetical protein
MIDSEKQMGDCRHGAIPTWCVLCLRAEVARLKSLALTCCSCGAVLASLEELKSHIVACPEHPIALYVRLEREACAQLAYRHLGHDAMLIAEKIRARSNS